MLEHKWRCKVRTIANFLQASAGIKKDLNVKRVWICKCGNTPKKSCKVMQNESQTKGSNTAGISAVSLLDRVLDGAVMFFSSRSSTGRRRRNLRMVL